MRKILWLSFLFFTLISCRKEENLTTPDIDERLKFFFDSFQQEGASRGQLINMKNITGQITDIETDGVLGRCNQSTSGTKQLLIDSIFWGKANLTEKEYVIFHELGHCALNRRHLDATNTDGTCISMMQSGNGSCKMIYNAQNRRKYLDELFSQ